MIKKIVIISTLLLVGCDKLEQEKTKIKLIDRDWETKTLFKILFLN